MPLLSLHIPLVQGLQAPSCCRANSSPYLPEGHFLHADSFIWPVLSENFPGSQRLQSVFLVMPLLSLHIPLVQGLQSLLDLPTLSDHLPKPQSMHLFLSRYCPRLHAFECFEFANMKTITKTRVYARILVNYLP
jgi:hypothetical protein